MRAEAAADALAATFGENMSLGSAEQSPEPQIDTVELFAPTGEFGSAHFSTGALQLEALAEWATSSDSVPVPAPRDCDSRDTLLFGRDPGAWSPILHC